MPVVRIDVIGPKSPAYKKALLDGVHEALVEAFKIPEDDRNQIISEHSREDFETRSIRTNKFTIIEIVAFPGRSLLTKRKFYKLIGEKLAFSPGITADDILVILREPPLDNWGIRGCNPASEIDIGFKLNV